ncbi:MAG: M48 family metalloprotease [Rhodobacteraceae bacterium]|nr:M48 family metalloprotease [Paracoccaceae bacterium]
MRFLGLLAAGFLAGCTVSPVVPPNIEPSPHKNGFDADLAARNFIAVVERVEPVAERMCREKTRDTDCDFQIMVDTRPGQPPNAFQTLNKKGQPVIAFTLALIADTRNQDELAFVMSHEAAHHIAGHLGRTQASATAGAVIAGTIVAITGAGDAAVQTAQQIGATVGARSYSKEFELEADRLGTVIAFRSGYDPARGAAYFARIPDPGDKFLGSHPPNARRVEAVRETLATLR